MTVVDELGGSEGRVQFKPRKLPFEERRASHPLPVTLVTYDRKLDHIRHPSLRHKAYPYMSRTQHPVSDVRTYGFRRINPFSNYPYGRTDYTQTGVKVYNF